MSPAQQRCDGGVTRWWAQGLKGQHVCQGAWEVLQLGLPVHPVTVPWSHHAGTGRSPPSQPSCKRGAWCILPLAALHLLPLGPFRMVERGIGRLITY